jgi:DNA polymerase-3 subunit gamma/tau
VAYVVLARKYRPQRFADLVGQEHVTRTLANAIAHNRVHHAYLFCGGRGLGKTTAARLLAKCLVCVKGPTIDPCNVCNECTAVTEGRSVDVIEIDGASNNRVEDVRNLRDQVRYLPQTARRKIYIIDEVHMLTGSAFNALLKTLEEPPEHVTFIFATTEVHELPATILSRVSRFDFRRLSSAQLVAHLQNILRSEGVSVEEAGLYTVARAGDGSVRDSLTLLDKVIAFASDTNKVSADEVRVVLGVPGALAVAGLVEAVLARDPTLTLRRFDEVFASGQDLLALALEFLKHLRDLMIVKLCGTREVLVDASDSEYEQLTSQAAAVDSVVLAQLFDRFTRVVDALPRTRVPRLVLEMGLLDLVHSEPLMPLGDLIDRLEQISTGAPGGGGGGSRSAAPNPAARSAPAPAPVRSTPAPEPRPRVEPSAPIRPSAAPPVDNSSPFSKILAGAGLVGPDPMPVETSRPSPTPAVDRPRPAEVRRGRVSRRRWRNPHRGRTTPAGAIRRSRPSKRLGLPRSPAPKRGRSPVPLQPLLRLKRPKIAALDAPARRNRRPRA